MKFQNAPKLPKPYSLPYSEAYIKTLGVYKI